MLKLINEYGSQNLSLACWDGSNEPILTTPMQFKWADNTSKDELFSCFNQFTYCILVLDILNGTVFLLQFLDGEKICHLLHVIGGFLIVFLRLSVGVIVLKMAALGPVIG